MKRLVILGGGESGVGTAILGKQKGWEVFLSDRNSFRCLYTEYRFGAYKSAIQLI